MTINDLCDRARVIAGFHFDTNIVATVYYNELIDLLLSMCPDIVSKRKKDTISVGKNSIPANSYELPAKIAKIADAYDNKMKRACYKIVDNYIVFCEPGEYLIVHTIKPKNVVSHTEPLEHNPVFDVCIPYFILWKIAVSDNLSDRVVSEYHTQFQDNLNIVIAGERKRIKGDGIKYIKAAAFM